MNLKSVRMGRTLLCRKAERGSSYTAIIRGDNYSVDASDICGDNYSVTVGDICCGNYSVNVCDICCGNYSVNASNM